MDKLHTIEVRLFTHKTKEKTIQKIEFLNMRTRTIYHTIPVEDFGKNPEQCINTLFELIQDYQYNGYDIEISQLVLNEK